MIDETGLELILRNEYSVKGADVALIRTGVDGNQTFKVTAGTETFIARIYGEQCRLRPEWAEYELELLAHLVSRGISVAAPIRTRRGALIAFGEPVESQAEPIALFSFADGGVEWPTSPGRAHLLGESFARLHVAADEFRSQSAPRALDHERLISHPLELMRLYFDTNESYDRLAWTSLKETADRAAEMLRAIPEVGGAVGPIHGDLHQGNCHFTTLGGSDSLTFFDFSNAGMGWRAYDLSGFLWPLRDATIKDPRIRAACDSFLEGYRTIRRLLPEEEAAIGACVRVRDLWETGCWLEYNDNLENETVKKSLRSLAAKFECHSSDPHHRRRD